MVARARCPLQLALPLALAASLAGCGSARRIAGEPIPECVRCHGAPPATGAHLVHANPVSVWNVRYGGLHVLEDVASAGAAPAKYDFGCGHCHPLDPAQHLAHVTPKVAGARVPDVVLGPGGAAPTSLKARNSALAAYDPTSRTCSGVWCHSSGQDPAAMTSLSYRETPAWDGPAGSLGCGGCHGNPPRYPSGGAGAPDANSHLTFDAWGPELGWETGHYAGMPGPDHGGGSKHGGDSPSFPLDAFQSASPITCQACHADTVDPANVAPGGFFWLDTTGDYQLPGGDPARLSDPDLNSIWRTTQCSTCHFAGGPAPVMSGRVLPLRHVNGKRDVAFDRRAALDEGLVGAMPLAPPFPPYAVTYFTPVPSDPGTATTTAGYWELPADGVLLATSVAAKPVYAASLEHAAYDPATKTCSNVGCHVGRASLEAAGRIGPLRWGAPYDSFGTTCAGCHNYSY